MNSSNSNDLAPTTPRRPPTELVARGLPRRPSALSSPPDALGLLKALRRRWAAALGLGLLAAALIGPAAWFLMPPAQYTANATLYVSMNPKRIMWNPQDTEAQPETFQKTQVALLTDRFILGHALAKPEVAKLATIQEQLRNRVDPEDWLKEHLGARFSGESEVLELSLCGDRPEDLKTIVNAVIDSYLTQVVDAERQERLERLEQLRQLWDKYQSDLKFKRKSLEDLAHSIGSHDQNALAVTQQFKVAQVNLAQSEQMRVNSELLKAQAELAALQGSEGVGVRPGADTPAVPDSVIDRQVDRHPDVAALKAQVDEWTGKCREVRRRVRNASDPSLLAAQRQLQAATRDWGNTRAQVRAGIRAGQTAGVPADPVFADRAQELARVKARIGVLKGYQEALARNTENLQKEIRDLTRGGLDVEADREEISIATEFARKVGAEVEYVQVELNAPDRVRVLARAKTPRVKDELKKVKAGGGAALASFALALLGVSFWEFRARRIDAAEEVINSLGLRLVGALPALPGRAHRLAAAAALPDQRWQSLLVESIDATRTMLLHASRVDAIRVVMIASATKGEGKTSLACHLATSLARANRRTLLVDGDLRCPAIHRLLDLPATPGLCELLRGEADVAGVIQETPAGGLDFLPAGRCDLTALQALATQDHLQTLFDDLKSRYDFLIVDSAPVLPVNDSLLLGQTVDAVLFSLLREVSRLPEVYAARERFADLGVKVLGAVVTGIQSEGYHAGYSPVSQPNR